MSVFCRHDRFTADCPICSKGTVLDSGSGSRRRPAASASTRRQTPPPKPAGHGPSVASPSYEGADGVRYVVRLERVPGGVRLAEWSGSELRRRAPVLNGADLVTLAASAGQALTDADADALAGATATEPGDPAAGPAVSKGRTGDFKEELRIEALEGGRVRVGRWVLRPAQGWQLQEAPPMLPAKRYAEAIAAAVRSGMLPRATRGT